MKITWNSSFSDYLKSFSGMRLHSFNDIIHAAFALFWHTHHLQTVRWENSQILTIWFFPEKVCRPLVQWMKHIKSKARVCGCDPGKDRVPVPDLQTEDNYGTHLVGLL